MITATPDRDVAVARNRDELPAIDVRSLAKSYGQVEAVRGVDFAVQQREIFGLIGPDGAGKTSTFQILAGVMEATSGGVNIFGRPAREMRSQTGYLTQTFSLYPDLTVAENIRYSGDLRRIEPQAILERGNQYLRMFDMDRFANRLAGKLSGGMRQKLSLICALVPQPRVLLLDEPTTGVDPVSRREFWDALAHLSAEGLTILVATPYLDEAERCNRIAFMHQGQFLHIGTPRELRAALGTRRLELRTSDLRKTETILSKLIASHVDILDVQRFGDRLDLLVHDPDEVQPAIRKGLENSGVTIDEMRVDDPTLENVFVAKLRSLGEKPATAEFPAAENHSGLRGSIAVGATHLD